MKSVSNASGLRDGVRGVAMDADTVHAHVHHFATGGDHRPGGDRIQYPIRDTFVYEVAELTARNQSTVGQVPAIGEELREAGQTGLLGHVPQHGSVDGQDGQPGVADGVDQRLGDVDPVQCQVVERPMCLDIGHGCLGLLTCPGEDLQLPAQITDQVGIDSVGDASTEADSILEGQVGADADEASCSQFADPSHRVWVAGVAAGRDVGTADEVEEGSVDVLTLATGQLTEVSVQVDTSVGAPPDPPIGIGVDAGT